MTSSHPAEKWNKKKTYKCYKQLKILIKWSDQVQNYSNSTEIAKIFDQNQKAKFQNKFWNSM